MNNFYAAAKGDGSREGLAEWSFLVAPEQAGAFLLSGSMSEGGSLIVQRCAPDDFYRWHLAEQGPWTYASTLPPQDPTNVLLLGPGYHRIRWDHALDPSAALDLKFAPQCTFEAQDCPENQQCTIWNVCAAQVPAPAALGQPCEEVDDETRMCVVGARCIGGSCTAECDETRPCGDGQACARERVCGPVCDLLAADCAPGFSCVPSGEAALTAVGRGQCVAAGDGGFFEACRRRESSCDDGLSCEYVDELHCHDGGFDGCCVPLCDPSATDPGCPDEVPYCDPLADGPAGVCRTRP
ncbi:hypothetical protein OV142_02765 [Nannocystis sp. SCPEA4]|nr:hypothetical protein [Nannocystis sp. SCPEA4]